MGKESERTVGAIEIEDDGCAEEYYSRFLRVGEVRDDGTVYGGVLVFVDDDGPTPEQQKLAEAIQMIMSAQKALSS